MRSFLQSAIMVAMVLLVSGCATKPTNTELPFDRVQSGAPHVIGLVKPAAPDHAFAPIPVGNAGGIAGLLVSGTVAVMRSNRESSLAEIVKTNNFSFNEQFQASLVAVLQGEGYVVKQVDLPRDGLKSFAAETIASRADLGVDAVLDITVGGYGYVAASQSDDAPYRPYVIANVQLLAARGAQNVLMKDTVVYNPFNNPKNVVSIPPDPRYNFVHFSDIESHPADAVMGMSVAADQTGQAIGRLLQ